MGQVILDLIKQLLPEYLTKARDGLSEVVDDGINAVVTWLPKQRDTIVNGLDKALAYVEKKLVGEDEDEEPVDVPTTI